MVSREDKKYVIWPAYFDRELSRRDGRRVPRNLSVEKPNLDKIFQIAKEMGLNPILEKDARYPYRHWKREGRVLVDTVLKKGEIILNIARRLK